MQIIPHSGTLVGNLYNTYDSVSWK